MIDELRDVVRAHESSRPRSKQRAIGPSEAGTTCSRRLAYRLAGFPHFLGERVVRFCTLYARMVRVLPSLYVTTTSPFDFRTQPFTTLPVLSALPTVGGVGLFVCVVVPPALPGAGCVVVGVVVV